MWERFEGRHRAVRSKSSRLSDIPGFIAAPDFSRLLADVGICRHRLQPKERGRAEGIKRGGKKSKNRNGRVTETNRLKSNRLNTRLRSAKRIRKNKRISKKLPKLWYNFHWSRILF